MNTDELSELYEALTSRCLPRTIIFSFALALALTCIHKDVSLDVIHRFYEMNHFD